MGGLAGGVLTLKAGCTLVDEDKHQLCTNTVYSGQSRGHQLKDQKLGLTRQRRATPQRPQQ